MVCLEDGEIAGIVIGSVVATLIFVGIIYCIVYLCCLRKKSKKDQSKDTGANYDNPAFIGDTTDKVDNLVKQDDENVEKGYGGYVTCREYEVGSKEGNFKERSISSNINEELKAKFLAQKYLVANGVHNGNGMLFSKSKSGSHSSLDDGYMNVGKETISIALQSQDIIGLGFNISGSMRDGIFVSHVHNRGPASECGKMKLGDRIMGITISFENIVYEDALTILSYASPYPVNLRIQKTGYRYGFRKQDPNRFSIDLHHPRYRSQSMDDVRAIGHEGLLRRARSEMNRVSSKSKPKDTIDENVGTLRKWDGYYYFNKDASGANLEMASEMSHRADGKDFDLSYTSGDSLYEKETSFTEMAVDVDVPEHSIQLSNVKQYYAEPESASVKYDINQNVKKFMGKLDELDSSDLVKDDDIIDLPDIKTPKSGNYEFSFDPEKSFQLERDYNANYPYLSRETADINSPANEDHKDENSFYPISSSHHLDIDTSVVPYETETDTLEFFGNENDVKIPKISPDLHFDEKFSVDTSSVLPSSPFNVSNLNGENESRHDEDMDNLMQEIQLDVLKAEVASFQKKSLVTDITLTDSVEVHPSNNDNSIQLDEIMKPHIDVDIDTNGKNVNTYALNEDSLFDGTFEKEISFEVPKLEKRESISSSDSGGITNQILARLEQEGAFDDSEPDDGSGELTSTRYSHAFSEQEQTLDGAEPDDSVEIGNVSYSHEVVVESNVDRVSLKDLNMPPQEPLDVPDSSYLSADSDTNEYELVRDNHEDSFKDTLKEFIRDRPSLLENLGFGTDPDVFKGYMSSPSNGDDDDLKTPLSLSTKSSDVPLDIDISTPNSDALNHAKMQIRHRSISSDDEDKGISSTVSSSRSASPQMDVYRGITKNEINIGHSGSMYPADETIDSFANFHKAIDRNSSGIAYYVNIDNHLDNSPPLSSDLLTSKVHTDSPDIDYQPPRRRRARPDSNHIDYSTESSSSGSGTIGVKSTIYDNENSSISLNSLNTSEFEISSPYSMDYSSSRTHPSSMIYDSEA